MSRIYKKPVLPAQDQKTTGLRTDPRVDHHRNRSAFGSTHKSSCLPADVPRGFSVQVFAVEVSAVELGLHIQLGQAGAKTEAQLGDQQLGAAKRLRHLLITNRWAQHAYLLKVLDCLLFRYVSKVSRRSDGPVRVHLG